MLFAAVFSICLGFVMAGAFFNNELLGQRGGAVGVAASFVALFASKDYGTRVQERFGKSYTGLLTKLRKAKGAGGSTLEQSLADLQAELQSLSAAINVDKAGERRQNYFIAASAGTATIFWGFGDLFVRWLRLLCT